MTKQRYGVIAGIAGAALAAWWWNRHRSAAARRITGGKGEVIFHNHPIPSSEGIL
jgi:hypothetical protein